MTDPIVGVVTDQGAIDRRASGDGGELSHPRARSQQLDSVRDPTSAQSRRSGAAWVRLLRRYGSVVTVRGNEVTCHRDGCTATALLREPHPLASDHHWHVVRAVGWTTVCNDCWDGGPVNHYCPDHPDPGFHA
jgi:hypothetical protein